MDVDETRIYRIEDVLGNFAGHFDSQVRESQEQPSLDIMFNFSVQLRRTLNDFIDTEAREEDVELLSAISSLWHLVEAFFICPYEEFLIDFRTWSEDRQLHLLDQDDRDSTWNILKTYALTGCFDKGKEMLEGMDFTLLARLFQIHPLIQPDESAQWRRLVTELRTKYAAHTDASELIAILSGDLDTIIACSEDWVTLTCARLLLCGARPDENLPALCHQSFLHLKQSPASVTPGSFDWAILATFQRDAPAILRYLDTTIQQTWFTFHIFHIFGDSSYCKTITQQLYEERLEDYLVYLKDFPSLRHVLILYGSISNKSNELINDICATIIPADDEDCKNLLQRLPQYCDAYRAICCNHAQSNWKRPGAAIRWYLMAQDIRSVDDYVQDLLSIKILQTKSKFDLSFDRESEYLEATKQVLEVLSNAGNGLQATHSMALLQNFYNIRNAIDEINILQRTSKTYPKSPERQAELFSALFKNLLQSRKLHRKFFVPLMVECKDFFAHHLASTMELSTYEGLVNGLYENSLHYDFEFREEALVGLKKEMLDLYVRIFSKDSCEDMSDFGVMI